ncbi:MAG: DUF805 domain-containing protein [Methanosarcinales archaeon]|jgi:uncharacterized membrane protein YhaH (DUF805 family)|nr:DUF805 domain-containing protein [Methanosarcinales archaeon]
MGVSACINKHFRSDDRINRKPFIIFTVFYWLLCFILPYSILRLYIADVLLPFTIPLTAFSYIVISVGQVLFIVFLISFWLMFTVFILCQNIRRLHDMNAGSGICFIYFLFFVPIMVPWYSVALAAWEVLVLFQLVLFIHPGTKGENKYGKDPLMN